MPSEIPTAKQLYQTLSELREPFLVRARDNAAVTVPRLCPPNGAGPLWRPPSLYQSLGARGVSNLAAKLLLALLPPNSSFFRLQVDVFEMKKIAQDENVKTQLESALAEVERAVGVEVETSATRTVAYEALRHLIVTGNGMMYVPEDGPIKFYRLDRFVVDRDPMGNVLTIVICEHIAPSALPDKIRARFTKEKKKSVDLYTVCKRSADGKRWDVWQEAEDLYVPDTDGEYLIDECPFIPLRFGVVEGEDYGRGYVEDYIGDLTSLESLSQAVVEAGVAASKVLFLVAPNGVTSPRQLAKAKNGDFIAGRQDDVSALSLDKARDLQFVSTQVDALKRDLAAVFLLTSALQRDAERVTAEEIRALVQELETSLGGVYSVLAQDLQLPLSRALMARMSRQKRLPKLPKKIVRPAITTGVEALGRGNDLQKLKMLMDTAKQAFPPQNIERYINIGEFMAKAATALSIDVKGLVYTSEEIQARDAQAAQAQQSQDAIAKLGPAAIRAVGPAMVQQQQPPQ